MADPGRGAHAIRLAYGNGAVELRVDPARFRVLEAHDAEQPELTADELRGRLDSPIGSPGLDALLSPGDRVTIVVPDATRASGSDRVTAALLARLGAIGTTDERIAILVGGGTHPPTVRP